MKKTGFINTFISVCSGTEAFPELIKQPFLRTFWHFLVLAVVCGLINVAFRLHPFNKSFEECCTNLSRRFGEIQYTEQGMLPSIRPNEAHSATSVEDFRVDYLPDIEMLKTYKPKKEFPFGIVWTPTTVLYWDRNYWYDDDITSITPLLLPDYFDIFERLSQMQKEIEQENSQRKELDKKAETKSLKLNDFSTLGELLYISPETNSGQPDLPLREFKTNVLAGIPMSLPFFFVLRTFFFIALNMWVVSWVYLIFFASFSFMFGRANLLKLKFKELLSMCIYTGFPGFVIATLGIALDLRVLDFQSIFLITYFIYSFAVFGRIRKTFLPPPKRNNDKLEF